MAAAPRVRWVFTLNNYTEDECKLLKEKLTEDSCKYAIVGKEVGEKGTPHLQGYVNLKKKVRRGGIQKMLPARCWIKHAASGDLENQQYCSKDNNVLLQVGKPSASGTERGGGNRRTELAVDYAKKMAAGVSSEELLQDPEMAAAYLHHWKAIDNLKRTLKQNAELKKMREEFSSPKWMPWQYDLLSKLDGELDV